MSVPRSQIMAVVGMFVVCLLVAQSLHPSADEPSPNHRHTSVSKRSFGRFLDDVADICTPEDCRKARLLTSGVERCAFIDAFWGARDPDVSTIANEFREDHYRRIAVADLQFGTNTLTGSKTDRGRILIRFGPADQVKRVMPESQLGSPFPYEVWHYRSVVLNGIPTELDLEFVDPTIQGMVRLDAETPISLLPKGCQGQSERQGPNKRLKLTPR